MSKKNLPGHTMSSKEIKKLMRWRGQHKYNAKRTEVDEINFDSRAEANRYSELKILQRTGEVSWFIRQPMFDLPGGIKYKADFLIVWKDGKITVEDVKGFKTQVYKLKKRQVENLYPVRIVEV